MTLYRTIVADPPWQYDRMAGLGSTRAVTDHYATMTPEEIKALPVEGWAADNAHLYLWVTNLKLHEARAFEIRIPIGSPEPLTAEEEARFRALAEREPNFGPAAMSWIPGLLATIDALRAALVRTPETLDVERARQAFHVEYEWQDIGCQHKNQYPKTWDCHKRVIEFAEVYNAAAPTPETET